MRVTEATRFALRPCTSPSSVVDVLVFSGVGAAQLPGAVTGALLLSWPAAVRQPLPHRRRSPKHRTRASRGQELLLLLSREVGGDMAPCLQVHW